MKIEDFRNFMSTGTGREADIPVVIVLDQPTAIELLGTIFEFIPASTAVVELKVSYSDVGVIQVPATDLRPVVLRAPEGNERILVARGDDFVLEETALENLEFSDVAQGESSKAVALVAPMQCGTSRVGAILERLTEDGVQSIYLACGGDGFEKIEPGHPLLANLTSRNLHK